MKRTRLTFTHIHAFPYAQARTKRPLCRLRQCPRTVAVCCVVMEIERVKEVLRRKDRGRSKLWEEGKEEKVIEKKKKEEKEERQDEKEEEEGEKEEGGTKIHI